MTSFMCLFDTFVFDSSKESKLYSTTTISLILRQQRGVVRACLGQLTPLAHAWPSLVWA